MMEEILCFSPSTKSILSSDASIHIKFECEEQLESVLPSRSYFARKDTTPIKKGSSSFVNSLQITEAFEYEPLDIEEIHSPPLTAWQPQNLSYYTTLAEKELEYMPNPYSLDSPKCEITSKMRSILVDWMMEVCSEFCLKRETCYLAVNHLDRFISVHPRLKRREFQLLGLSAMLIASKTEEIYPPKVEDWARAADNGYTNEQIIQTEKTILNSLKFKVLPTTTCSWVNWLMSQWDCFVDYHFGCVPFNRPKDFANLPPSQRELHQKLYEKRCITFKEANQRAYKRFRETMQILDVSVLSLDSGKYLPRVSAGALVYLMVSKYFYETNYSLLYYNGPEEEGRGSLDENLNGLLGDSKEMDLDEMTQDEHVEGAAIVQELYSGFLAAALEITSIDEIYPAVAFFHPFLELEVVYDLPNICKTMSKARIESHYEEFLAFQTHNQHNLLFVSR